MPVHLHGLGTALPPHVLDQSEVAARAADIFGGAYPQFDRLARSFKTSGIEQRHSVVPIEWFEAPHGWGDRSAAYLKGARMLFVQAVSAALSDAGWSAKDVDCVVTVSTTGIATPSLEAQVFGEMGFRGDVMRVPVFGLGCAGGVSGLGTAEALARSGMRVLLVVVETCSLAFRADRMQKADIIAAVLFGDGAAAACLGPEAPVGPGRTCITLGAGHQKIWPDTLEIMGWDVDDAGLGVVFDRSIPGFVAEHFAGATAGALNAAGLTTGNIDRYVCHPGGAKVVTAIEEALNLTAGTLDSERDVLRRCGNMSAPTVLFVLQSVLASGATGQMMACALGPGFTASFLPLHIGGIG
ncbi:type III polyketide synthase [Roseovarius nanhaiticus]|uniref:type III polyketide synthase n=1 Tax=Roseovarius nanhaiticus TaxID=573024 RepID=UPI0024935CA3|nr:type III polyketide synthase [Roseovarius nanhaiticus]